MLLYSEAPPERCSWEKVNWNLFLEYLADACKWFCFLWGCKLLAWSHTGNRPFHEFFFQRFWLRILPGNIWYALEHLFTRSPLVVVLVYFFLSKVSLIQLKISVTYFLIRLAQLNITVFNFFKSGKNNKLYHS